MWEALFSECCQPVRRLRSTSVLFPAALLVLEPAAAGTGGVATGLVNGDRFRFHHGALAKIPAPFLTRKAGTFVVLTRNAFFAEAGDEFDLACGVIGTTFKGIDNLQSVPD